MSLETSYTALQGNGRTEEILNLIKLWENLRLKNYFSKNIRTKMQDPPDHPAEFTLRHKPTGGWQVLPVTYSEHQVTALDGVTDHWTLSNPYAPQPVFITIESNQSQQAVGNPGLKINVIRRASRSVGTA